MKSAFSMTNEQMNPMVRDALDSYTFVGVRGLPQRDAAKKYRTGQLLAKSYTHYDDQPNYKLRGTSTMVITHEMTDAQIIKIVEYTRKMYSDSDKVILVVGDDGTVGIDQGEIVISNHVSGKRRGGRFLGYLDNNLKTLKERVANETRINPTRTTQLDPAR